MIRIITYKSRSFEVDLCDTSETHSECRKLVASGEWTYTDYARFCELVNDAMHRFNTRPLVPIYVRMRAWRFKATEFVEQVFCFDDLTLEESMRQAESVFKGWFPSWCIDAPLVIAHESYLQWADDVYTLIDFCEGRVSERKFSDA